MKAEASTCTAISNREFLGALVVAMSSLAISAALLIGGYLLAFPHIYPEYLPESESARPFTLAGKDLTPVMPGTVQREGGTALVTALAPGAPDDQAIMRRTVNLPAANFAFLRYHLEGRHPGLRIMLFWKTAASGDEPFYGEIDNAGDGTQYHNLRRSEDWQGTITEIAIGVFGDLRGESLGIRELRLEPYSAGGLLGTVWDEWTAFAPWDQKSINRYDGAQNNAIKLPNAAFSVWLVIAVAIGWLTIRLQPQIEPEHWPYPLPVNTITIICNGLAIKRWLLDPKANVTKSRDTPFICRQKSAGKASSRLGCSAFFPGTRDQGNTA